MSTLFGASVIPFAVDPRFNIPYFWMGQEDFHDGWPSGSWTWSDFGGRVEPGEDAEACAAREFVEESLQCIMPSVSAATITEQLRGGDYLARIDAQGSDGGQYVTFVVQVPWDTGMRARFMRARRGIEDGTLDPSHPAWVDGGIAAPYREKANIQLWSLPNIRHAIYRRPRGRCLRFACIGRMRAAMDVVERELKLKWCVTAPMSRLLSINKQPTSYARPHSVWHPPPRRIPGASDPGVL